LVFFDDILIYSLTWTEHLHHVEQILFLLFSQGYFAKFTKCEFGVQSVQYLGHIISLEGAQADPEKLEAIGVVLSQNYHPIAFLSRKLSPRLVVSSTYVRELYALAEAVKKWRQYLLGHTFKIYTDHQSLKSLMTQSIHTLEQQKWLSKLMGYNYQILYTPGKENTVADALSRTSDKANLVSFHAFLHSHLATTSETQRLLPLQSHWQGLNPKTTQQT